MSDSIKLPELPQAWGTMYGKYQDKELDGFTADQMRGYAQDAVIAALAAAPSVPNWSHSARARITELEAGLGACIPYMKYPGTASPALIRAHDAAMARAQELLAAAPEAPQQG